MSGLGKKSDFSLMISIINCISFCVNIFSYMLATARLANK